MQLCDHINERFRILCFTCVYIILGVVSGMESQGWRR